MCETITCLLLSTLAVSPNMHWTKWTFTYCIVNKSWYRPFWQKKLSWILWNTFWHIHKDTCIYKCHQPFTQNASISLDSQTQDSGKESEKNVFDVLVLTSFPPWIWWCFIKSFLCFLLYMACYFSDLLLHCWSEAGIVYTKISCFKDLYSHIYCLVICKMPIM